MDVCASVTGEVMSHKKVIGGTYGLSSREFTPNMVKGIIDNLTSEKPKKNFCIGIDDDVTHTSLAYPPAFSVIPDTIK